MSKIPGRIRIHPIGHPDREFYVECHVEDEDTWGGYSLISPLAGWQDFSKARYVIVDDYRQEV